MRYTVIPERRPRPDPETQLAEFLAHMLALVELDLTAEDLVGLARRFVEAGRGPDLANGLTTCEVALEVLTDWQAALQGDLLWELAEYEAEY
jgi:hypothetical protein